MCRSVWARTVRADPYEIRTDTAFPRRGAGLRGFRARARGGPGSTTPIERLYVELHALGFAHSVECWQDGVLVGGLYGVLAAGRVLR